MKLTEAAIARLRPREQEFTVWDSRMTGLGVRVRPSGGKSYVLLLETGGRSRRLSLGPVSARTVVEARRECHARKANPEREKTGKRQRTVPLFQDFVAGPWKKTHFDRYKPSTRRSDSYRLNTRLLPAFGTKPLDRITPAHVRQWFERYSRTAPGGANRALEVLQQIMNFAISSGHIDTNPARDVRKNRRAVLTRFLSLDEVGRLHRVLDAQTRTECRQQADIIRLLLLTGCRKGEIVCLRWSEVHPDMLVLADSKTGPRQVPLNSQARRILDCQPRGESDFVFPSPLDSSRHRGATLPLWYRVRREAGIENVRLHDLRHTMASHAVMNGVPIPVVSRLLGHSNARTTLRYAHLGDREIQSAAERIGTAMVQVMGRQIQSDKGP